MSPGPPTVDSVAATKGLGLAVQELRRRRGLTQAELARRADVSSSWISKIESGHANPRIELCRRIAESLGYRRSALFSMAEELIPGEEEKIRRERSESARAGITRPGGRGSHTVRSQS